MDIKRNNSEIVDRNPNNQENIKLGGYVRVSHLLCSISISNFVTSFGLFLGIRQRYLERKQKQSIYQDIEVFVAGGIEYDKLIDKANRTLADKYRKKHK